MPLHERRRYKVRRWIPKEACINENQCYDITKDWCVKTKSFPFRLALCFTQNIKSEINSTSWMIVVLDSSLCHSNIALTYLDFDLCICFQNPLDAALNWYLMNTSPKEFQSQFYLSSLVKRWSLLFTHLWSEELGLAKSLLPDSCSFFSPEMSRKSYLKYAWVNLQK